MRIYENLYTAEELTEAVAMLRTITYNKHDSSARRTKHALIEEFEERLVNSQRPNGGRKGKRIVNKS